MSSLPRRAVWGLLLVAGLPIGVWLSMWTPYFSSPLAQRNESTRSNVQAPAEPSNSPSPFESSPPMTPAGEVEIQRSKYHPSRWELLGATPSLPETFEAIETVYANWAGLDLPEIQTQDTVAEFDGRRIQLMALGLSVPRGGGTKFYFPDGAPVQSGSHQIPNRLLDWKPEKFRNGPILRMIFREQGGDHFHSLATYVFDAQTNVLVGGGSAGIESPHREGEYVALDAQLKIWHSTQLEIVIGLPTGKPEIQPHSQTPGQITRIGGASFAILATGQGEVTAVQDHQEKAYDPPMGGADFTEDSPGRYLITYLEHIPKSVFSTDYGIKSRLALRIVRPINLGPYDCWFGNYEFNSYGNADVINLPVGAWQPDRDALELRLYPDQRWVCWRTPLLDLPNSGWVKNLFEVKMAEVSVEADGAEVHREEIWPNILAVVLNATELRSAEANNRIAWRTPEQDRLHFENITPRELLTEILRAHPGLNATIDPHTHTLTLTRTKPWQDRLREWWKRKSPFPPP